MALKNLTDNEMVALSAAWVDAKRARGLLEAQPMLAGLLPAIDEAHAALLAAGGAKTETAEERERAALYQECVALDQRHDRVGRGVFQLLGALADLSDDPDEAAALLATRTKLFPENSLAVLSATWKGQAGNAHRLKETVLSDPEIKAALKAIPLSNKRTLLDGARAFVDAGLELGRLDDRRTSLTDASVKADGRAQRGTARNRWIALGNTLVHLIDDVIGLTGAERHAVIGALVETEAKADARAASRQSMVPTPPTEAKLGSDATD